MGWPARQATVPEVHKLPLGKLHGQTHQYRGVPVIATYHPAYLLRNLPDKAKAWADWDDDPPQWTQERLQRVVDPLLLRTG